MDKKTIDLVCAGGKQRELESEIRRLLRASSQEHKRIDVAKLLYRQGVSDENIARVLAKPHAGEVKKVTPHQRPDAVARRAQKKKMKSRRR